MAKDGRINIVIDVDGKQISAVSKELINLEDTARSVSKGLKSATDSVDDLGDSSKTSANQVKSVKDSLDDVGYSSTDASKQLKGAKNATEDLADSASDGSKQLKSIADSADGMTDSAADLSKANKSAADSNDDLGDSASKATKSVDGLGATSSESSEKIKDLGDTTNKSSISVKELATSFGLVKVASVAFNVMKSSINGAVSRFDTLNQFPKVLEAMGVSAEDAEMSMAKLSDGIDGLPTTLDEISSNAQRMYTSFGDMDKATDTTVALNNALLGSGSNSAKAQRGVEQYMRALQRGQMDMTIWSTLSETMDVGLVKIAESFGYAGKSAKDDLYSALKDGTVTLDDFNDKLIEVGTGTGVMAELARENSLGVATSFGNLQTAAVRGLANVIDALNDLSKEVTGNDIAQNIDSMKGVVNAAFSLMTDAVKKTTPLFKAFGTVVEGTISIAKPLTPVLVGIAAAFAMYTVITKTMKAIDLAKTSIIAAKASTEALTISTKKNITTMAIKEALTKAENAAKIKGVVLTQAEIAAIKTKTAANVVSNTTEAANLGVLSVKNVLIGLLTGSMTVNAAATAVAATASKAFGVALQTAMGPIGWVTLGIGALVGAVTGLVKWFTRSTAESKEFKKATEKLNDETESFNSSIEQSATSHKENTREIKATAAANSDLAKKINDLANKENKSLGEKKMLNDMIEQMNESVPGLSLAFDEQADSLNKTEAEMNSYIETAKKQAEIEAINERLIELTKEKMKAEEQQAEVQKKLIELNEEENISNRDKRKMQKELEEQNGVLSESIISLGENIEEYGEKATTAYEDVANSSIESAEAQGFALVELSQTQETAIESMQSKYDDLAEVATNAFSKISNESDLSAQEMIENLKHNQEVVAGWGQNVAELHEKAGQEGNEGFLQWLDQLGPDSAAELAIVNNMTETQLKEFMELMNNGAEVATSAFSESLGDGFDDSIEAFKEFGQLAPQTLREELEAADLNSIGRAVGEGLAGGVSASAEEAVHAVESMAENAIDAGKDVLEVNSPSKVFDEIGRAVPEGMAQGVEKLSQSAVMAVRSMCLHMEMEARNNAKKMTNIFDQLVSGSDSSLQKLPNVASKNMSAMNKSFSVGSKTSEATIKSLNNNIISTFKNTPTQFLNIGKNIMSRMNSAISSEANRVITTTKNTANRIMQSFSNTPNQMQNVGRNSMSRLNSGLQSGSPTVVSTASRTRTQIVSSFNNLPSSMNSVGRNAMSGLNRGLISGSGTVIATANRIANQVAATMKRALNINSPSKVMENEVGRWIPEGIAVGIEKYAGSAYQAIDNLSEGMLRVSTPEMALGTSRMGREVSNQVRTQNATAHNSAINLDVLAKLINSRPIQVQSILDGQQVSKSVDNALGSLLKRRAYTGGVNLV
ncbi:hypothetical protein A5886_001800 [Enterococcus sp. 8G7_MSG3316]|uniref:Tape measure protein N-terminal domain-containing protein n=1 Tax=Candidatus Enterococcus testudinis TaxID=1834191 RepID=A0A242A7L8_9ENTE|nr:tape measure protein [Enterococcus sp. 8G7_MSG3316]OTN76721.1 hypothetical protein A5886_001800 [Enterococcus sp. 8G7_MSG3316]